jgi:hypothetical protein
VGEAISRLWLIRPIISGGSSDVSRRGASIRKYDPAKDQSNDEEGVGMLDGAMHVWAVLYRATRTKILCMEGSHWNQGE